MVFDGTIKFGDIAIVLATFLGPVFAVRTQRRLDDRKAVRASRERLFQTLMGTRATWLAPVRVEALNAIPTVFYGKSQSLKDINEAWRELLHHFDVASSPQWKEEKKAWEEKRLEFDINLLRLIGSQLGFQFPALDVRTQHYFPVAHNDRITDEDAIRRGLAAILSGTRPLQVTPIVPDPVFAEISEIRTSLKKVLSGDETLTVRVEAVRPPPVGTGIPTTRDAR